MTYFEAVEAFLRYLEIVDRSGETILGYKKELKYFGDFLEDKYSSAVKVDMISIVDLEDYMYHIKKLGKMPSTRSRVVYILRSFYSYLCKRDLVQRNLAELLESVKVKQAERVSISEEEMILLSKNIDKPIIRAVVQTMFYTGLRVSEVVNLDMDNVVLDEKLIYVIGGKGDKDRIVPISDKLYSILNDYIVRIRPHTDSRKFFCTSKTGKVSPQYINVMINKASESLKWDKPISAHTMRHSFASNLVLNNASLPTIQKLLGHSDLRVTSRYIHQDLEQLKDAVNVL